MARIMLVLLLAAAWAPAAAVNQKSAVTPIQKVLTMMNDMLGKAKAEKDGEEIEFAEFKTFCSSTMKEKAHMITKAKDKIEQLEADIDKAGSEAAVLSKEMGDIDADVATWEGEGKEQAYQREKAHADFLVTHEEYTESVESVNRAVQTMKSGGASAAFLQAARAWGGPDALLELSSRTLSSSTSQMQRLAKARQVMQSFLQRDANTHDILMQDAMDSEAPEAAAYGAQSGGILEMVKGLGDKFEEEQAELEKAESTEAQAFRMMQQDLTNQIESANKMRSKKASKKGDAEKNQAEAKGDLAETSATLEEDEKFLSDTTAECEQRAVEFEQNQETRAGEIEAIGKAIEIMSSDKVQGKSALVQQPDEGLALIQLRTTARAQAQDDVAKFLAERAQATNSGVLSLLSQRVGSDPFEKVTKMIKDMIIKLQEEATEEAEHKGFCDTEMGQNTITRDSKTEESESLQAMIDELTADASKLGLESADLGAAISAIDGAVSKATAIRTEEKAKNEATIADAKVAQDAVGQATAVLKEFYEKAGSAALAQQSNGVGPINYDERAMAIISGGEGSFLQSGASAPYNGQEGGGVLGMLEVIASDFARLESETAAGEVEAAKSFEDFSNDSATDKAAKQQDMKSKGNMKQKKESEAASAKKNLEGTIAELDAAIAYFEKLKPSCVDAGETYEERVQRRKEEIESLQEALQILSGEAI